MRLKGAPLLAYAVMVVLSLVLLATGVGSARFARFLALRDARADTHRALQPGETCASCHTSTHRPPLIGACDDCHSTRDWKSIKHEHSVAALDEGAHKGLACSRCHRKGAIPQSSACSACHRTAAHVRLDDCASCHNVSSWTDSHKLPAGHARLLGTHAKAACPDCHTMHSRTSTWVCTGCHKKHTAAFKLEKGHADLSCNTCHTQRWGQDNLNKIAVRANDCASCHAVEHRSLTKCAQCHTTTDFQKSTFDHGKTGFARTGGHAEVACERCHTGRQWASTPGTRCASCHKARHGGLTDCARCHTTADFGQTTFEHSDTWRLTGKHASLACAKCHPNDQWAISKGTTCVACHGREHGGLTDCARCHTTAGFAGAQYDHESGRWPLVGKHAGLACEKCHAAKRWADTKGTTCSACHAVKHAGLKDCASCHTMRSFTPSTFRHSSAYVLDGAHASTACEECHAREQYGSVKGTTCAACHGTKHGGQVRCERCHTTKAWLPIKLVQHTSAYPLTGAHKYVECTGCHPRAVFRGTSSRCYSCHADKAHCEHKDCERCHTTETWRQIKPHEMLPHTSAPSEPAPAPPADEEHSHEH